ncbi:serine hydrolase domain-containing protein [Aeoliella mucimassa]|uniref:Penicillin-binding protein 4 n=1 Tax=Aeoliella mucimassa TaxID=2527972 RepID=A0A518AIL1_9BACT|nr:serine hydrolase domain-containing protein [Aeoliella mucimassa]QDU54568.1 Penicillin-binding protein 4* [Aeoliella mucimassa]
MPHFCTSLLLFACLTSAVALGQSEPAATEPEVIDGIPITGTANPDLRPVDEMMVELIKKIDAPGASVAISRDGVLVYARGFGYQDEEQAEPVEPNTRFRIASISKPITATAIMALVHDGKLSLDDKLVDHLTDEERAVVNEELAPVTLRQLLQHRAGWNRDKTFDPMFKSRRRDEALGIEGLDTTDKIIRGMLPLPLSDEPGSKYSYSNFGYCVLGRIIERTTGQPYDEYVKQRVLAQQGISTMAIGSTLTRGEHETRYHTNDGRKGPGVVEGVVGQRVPVQYGAWCLENMDAHGGWIATAADLVAFADGYNDNSRYDFLTDDLLAEVVSPCPADEGKNSYYGLGWLVVHVGDKQHYNMWHNGSLPGTSTILVRRHDGFNWAVLFNTRDIEGGGAPSGKVDPLMHEAVNKVQQWPAQPVSVE